uniref:Uncharacterized protein n=1 Tax=Meloidogyne hapla TaxID=6305 RepID=A0A1I8BL53_MELHA
MIFPKIYFSLFFLFSLIYLINSQEQIPQKFFGAFQYGNSDNWEGYLAAKGYNEEMRRTVKPPQLTRVLFPSGPGYRMMIGMGLQGSKWLPGAKKNADWMFQLGKEFRAKYWDGREHLTCSSRSSSAPGGVCLRNQSAREHGYACSVSKCPSDSSLHQN